MANVGFEATGNQIGVRGNALDPHGSGVEGVGASANGQTGQGGPGVTGFGGTGFGYEGGTGVLGLGGQVDGGTWGFGVVGIGGGGGSGVRAIDIPSSQQGIVVVGDTVISPSSNIGAVGVVGVGGFLSPGVVGKAGYGFNDPFSTDPLESPNNIDGVQGFGVGPGGAGVHGISKDNGAFGVFGESNGDVYLDNEGAVYQPVGVLGSCSGVGGIGILGECSQGNYTGPHHIVYPTIAVFGISVSGGLAGGFAGDVKIVGNLQVEGNFDVIHPGTKAAVMPFPDGSHRRLYSIESPESWFEDFGIGHLAKGRAEVQLAGDFASVVESANYHVFLSEYDDNNALFVTNRTPTGFAVRAKSSKTASGTFSYRIVAMRKDFEGRRLEKVMITTKLPHTKRSGKRRSKKLPARVANARHR
jgi:hypothetical protein